MQPSAPFTPPAGLCETCANVRIVQSGKGSRFYLCRLSAVDPAFPRYPRLPVLRCRGYTPADSAIVPEASEPAG
jgi:hypothetical protein